MLSKNTKKNSPLDNKNNYLNYVYLYNFKDINYKKDDFTPKKEFYQTYFGILF